MRWLFLPLCFFSISDLLHMIPLRLHDDGQVEHRSARAVVYTSDDSGGSTHFSAKKRNWLPLGFPGKSVQITSGDDINLHGIASSLLELRKGKRIPDAK